MRLVKSTDGDAAAAALAAVAAVRGHEGNLYRLLANSPNTLQLICDLVWGLWATVDSRLAELSILRVAQLLSAPYEWAHHADKALAAGVSPQQISELHTWQGSGAFDNEDKILLAVVDAAATGNVVPSRVLDPLLNLYPVDVCVEILTVIGLYRAIAVMLNSFDVELENWAPRTRSECDRAMN